MAAMEAKGLIDKGGKLVAPLDHETIDAYTSLRVAAKADKNAKLEKAMYEALGMDADTEEDSAFSFRRRLKDMAKAHHQGGGYVANRVRGDKEAVAVVDWISGADFPEQEEVVELAKQAEALQSEVESARAAMEAARGKNGRAPTKKYAAARDQYLAVTQKQTDLYDKAYRTQRVRDEAVGKIRNQLAEKLGVPEGERTKIEFKPAAGLKLSANTQARARKAFDWLQTVVRASPAKQKIEFEMRDADDGRASMAHDGTFMRLDDYDGEATIVHEFGHAIEAHFPEALEAGRQFLAHRVRDEKPQSLKQLFGGGYTEREMGRKDNFEGAMKGFRGTRDAKRAERAAYYVGKDYGQYATEILSMGLERLYDDPITFARQDPEYCAYVVGVLRGGPARQGAGGVPDKRKKP